MDQVTKKAIVAWSKRWRNVEVLIGNSSPFGVTASGAVDYRGAPLRQAVLKDLSVSNVDLTAANLHHVRIENCSFEYCSFDRAILTNSSVRASRFDNCQFRNADLTISHIGYWGTDFSRCIFDGARTKRAGFLNTTFADVNFIGEDWSNTDFGASGFWNCSFAGRLYGATFRGDYLFDYQKEIAGAPQRTGLHNVSFENADLYWVGFRNDCRLENVVLPANGSAFVCEAKGLISICVDFCLQSAERDMLEKYRRIKFPDPTKQQETIISKHDLIELGGEETGSVLYDFLKLKLAASK